MAHDLEVWPPLPLAEWKATCQTLQLWTQVVGKVRLALTPSINHWWHVPLYVTARGLTTSPIPYDGRAFEVVFDFLDHNLYLTTSAGQKKALALIPRSVAAFHEEFLALLHAVDIDVHVWRMPVELPDPIPFDEDVQHASYAPEPVERFFRVLRQTDRILKRLEGRFLGKQSPSHFFWGSFDLAQTRFSGRPAPERPGADQITREAYSHEVISFGFWPGTDGVSDAAFYAYAAPEPPGFKQAVLPSSGARYHPQLSEFVLPYAEVRQQQRASERIFEFFQGAYEAGASLAGWDRASLDRPARAEARLAGEGGPAHPQVHSP